MILQLKRNLKQGFVNFWRNGWVSLATVLIMVLTLFVFGSLLFANVILTSSLESFEDKVDISVYFKTTASENDVLGVKSSLENLSEVDSVVYISREQALEDFKKRHGENALITQSLEELGENPLGASLNVTAKDPNQYESISRFLEADIYKSAIDKINYQQNQIVIEKLNKILSTSRKIGFGVTVALSIIAILVAFNTIRLAIYTSRDEISIMKLVGATNSYIRGPFIVEGIIHGFLATIATMIMFWPVSLFLGPRVEDFFGGPDLFKYYISNFPIIFILLLSLGVVLGVISSVIATRRYLKV